MKVISHRGYWKSVDEKNLEVAFRRSFELGFGTETDLRDLDSEIVISHDMPRHSEQPILFSELLDLHASYNPELLLLLNIKADGLQAGVLNTVNEKKLQNYFLFDMSVPDLLVSLRAGLNCLTRHSEYEPQPNLYEQCAGVWMDEFKVPWITEATLNQHLEHSKQVFIVSPELHQRAHLERWAQYREMSRELTENCVLCTDLPEEAADFFSQ